GGDAALFTYAAEGGALPCTLPAPTTTPQVTRVTPGFGPATGGTPIRIEGVGFQLVGEPRTFADGSEGTLLAPPPVYVDGTPATDVRFVGATALEAVVPPGTPGTATVRVGGPSGLSPATDAATFLYVTDAGCLRCDDEGDPHALDLWVTRPHAVGDGADPVVRVAAVTDARG